MQRVDTFGNTGSLPAAEAQVNPPGFFTIGNPSLSVPATQVPAWWLNAIQEEILNVILAAGLTPDKSVSTQLRDSILGVTFDAQEATFAIANNQASPANITGMVLDKTKYKSARIKFDAIRTDAGQEISLMGELYAIYKPVLDAWELHGPTLIGSDDGDALGLTFSIVAATGQVQYTSSNFPGGSYTGFLRFKFDRFTI